MAKSRPPIQPVLPTMFPVRSEDDIQGMVHHDDPHTSVEAAIVIARKRTELHERVLQAFRDCGPMTDERLEELSRFEDYGPSTIRKRRSELYQDGVLVIVGEAMNSRGRTMFLWGLAGSVG